MFVIRLLIFPCNSSAETRDDHKNYIKVQIRKGTSNFLGKQCLRLDLHFLSNCALNTFIKKSPPLSWLPWLTTPHGDFFFPPLKLRKVSVVVQFVEMVLTWTFFHICLSSLLSVETRGLISPMTTDVKRALSTPVFSVGIFNEPSIPIQHHTHSFFVLPLSNRAIKAFYLLCLT